MEKVTILGLGAMGARMAVRLIEAGHQVTVYNRGARRAEALTERGAVLAETPRAAVAAAGLVIAMLTDDVASRSVWLDEQTGALAGMNEGCVAIESSTLSPAWVRELGEKAQARGVSFLDAPVAGSRPQAQDGKLIYFVGGDVATLERARPMLSTLGGALHHVGPVGTGAVMKLAVNALFGIQVAAAAEVLAMAVASGVKESTCIDTLSALPITSPAVCGVLGLVGARTFAPMFPIDLVAKDFSYATEAGQAVAKPMPTTTAVAQTFAAAQKKGLGSENIHAVAKLFL